MLHCSRTAARLHGCTGLAVVRKTLAAKRNPATTNGPGGPSRQKLGRRRGVAGSVLLVGLLLLLATPTLARPLKGKKFRTAYRQTLYRLASGETEIQALAELERQAVDDGSNTLARIRRTEFACATELAQDDRACLRALLWLHHELGIFYRQAGRFSMAGPAQMHTVDLAVLLHQRTPTAAETELVNRIMVCLAYSLLGEGYQNQAQTVFERIVNWDPDNRWARLGVAAIHERQGQYQAAIDHLEALIAAHPDGYEGQLRLAVCLARVARQGYSQRLLRELIAGPAADWIRIVSYQQLAQARINSGDLAAAEPLLWAGIAEFPDEHSLRIQLALAIDLDDRPVAAGTVIEDLRPTARARHPVKPAPRLRYGRWPHFDLAAAEAGLPETTDADADLSSLAQALAPEITSGQEP